MTLVRAISTMAAVLGLAQGAAAQSPAAGTRFTVRVENISRGEALRLSNGKRAPFVSAPVLWVIGRGSDNPIFIGGAPDRGEGLEALAETGNPSALAKALFGKSGIVSVGADARPVGAGASRSTRGWPTTWPR